MCFLVGDFVFDLKIVLVGGCVVLSDDVFVCGDDVLVEDGNVVVFFWVVGLVGMFGVVGGVI